MPKDTHSKLAVAGVVLLLCLPALVIGAGIYAYFAPRIYRSTVAVLPRKIDEVAFLRAFGAASRSYGKSVKIVQGNRSAVWFIQVYDADPRRSAEVANQIALDTQKQFVPPPPPKASAPEPTAPTSEAERRAAEARAFAAAEAEILAESVRPKVEIMEKAEPATAYVWPDVPVILSLATGAGLLPASIGIVILIVVWRTRRRQTPPRLPSLVHGN